MTQLMPFEQAIQHIQQSLETMVKAEQVPLQHALGRILAEDILAPINVPPAANSAMDGYAVHAADLKLSQCLPVLQRIAAGETGTPLAPMSCARIFTGAEIPKGADAVVMQENTEQTDAGIQFLKTVQPFENVRPAGQDISKGSLVFAKGRRLDAIDIGVLASLGFPSIHVFSVLKVGILTTGNELRAQGETLESGQIYNSNGPLLEALVFSAGHQVSQRLHAQDSVVATETALQSLTECSDIVISSGGVSVGEEDHVKNTIEKNGTLHLWKIAIKPGKPLVYAKVFNTPFIGLPGNPSSTLVTFHLFARIALGTAAGAVIQTPSPFPIICDFERKSNQSRDEFLRVYVAHGRATLHPQQSSGALLAASYTDGYLHMPAKHDVTRDSVFNFYPFNSF